MLRRNGTPGMQTLRIRELENKALRARASMVLRDLLRILPAGGIRTRESRVP
jgi:hypothetical protein